MSYAAAAAPDRMDAAALQASLSGKWGGNVVDFRSTAEFEAAHIPGSLSIPPHAIRAKSFLKSGPLVLVGSGADEEKALEIQKGLVATGFASVSILEGGMNAWRRLGGEVQGTSPKSLVWSRVTAEEISSNLDRDGWVVLAIDVDEEAVACAIPGAGVTGSNRLDSVQVLTGAIEAGAGGFATVVVIDPKGEYPQTVRDIAEEAVKEAKVRAALFYLDGGWEGYRDFLARAAAVPEKRVVKTEGTRSGMGPQKGCGACP